MKSPSLNSPYTLHYNVHSKIDLHISMTKVHLPCMCLHSMHHWSITWSTSQCTATRSTNHERYAWHDRKNKNGQQLRDYFRANSALAKVDACTIQGEHKIAPPAVSLPCLQDCLFHAWTHMLPCICMEDRNDCMIMPRVENSCWFGFGSMLGEATLFLVRSRPPFLQRAVKCFDTWQSSLWSHARLNARTRYCLPMIFTCVTQVVLPCYSTKASFSFQGTVTAPKLASPT